MKFENQVSFYLNLFSIPIFGVLLANCTEKESLENLKTFIASKATASVEVNFCSQPTEVIHTRTKYIFIMDHSGSNKDNFQLNQDGSIIGAGGQQFGTDPKGDRRYSDLINFLDKNPEQNPDLSYALIRFSDSSTVKKGFTTDRNAFKTVVDLMWHNPNPGTTASPKPTGVPDDGGFTNFYSALESARMLIETDYAAKDDKDPITGEQIAKTYIVVFISDGFPIVGWQNNDLTKPITQNTETILLRVRSLMSFGDDHPERISSINVFTGFYFLPENYDPKARNLLANMAHAGRGEAYAFGGSDIIDFSLFQVPTKVVKYGIEAIFASNQNVVWWNGEQRLDSDIDGLPDIEETAVNSNSTLRDSDGNGISDGVEYFLNKLQVAKGILYCTGMPFTTITQVVNEQNKAFRIYSDTDKDGINDCEELILGSQKTEFDSNGDLVPDGDSLFKGFMNPMTNAMKNDNDLDGMNNGDEIKGGLPIDIGNFQLREAIPYKYDLKVVSSSSTQDCYSLHIEGLPQIAESNTVRIEIVETATTLRKRKTFRAVEKSFDSTSSFLVIYDETTEPQGVWK